MIPKELNDWLQVLGLFGVLGGLVFVGMELRQQQLMAFNDSAYNIVESSRELRRAQAEHADIWARGNAGEDLDRSDGTVYELLIRLAWAHAFWVATTREAVGDERFVTVHDFAGFLHENPRAREVWESVMATEQLYRERLLDDPAGVELMNLVLADLEKLEASE